MYLTFLELRADDIGRVATITVRVGKDVTVHVPASMAVMPVIEANLLIASSTGGACVQPKTVWNV